MPRMLYCGLQDTSGGDCVATVRVQMPEVRQKDGKNRERLGPASEKVSALRRQSGATAVRSGDPVQRFGLVRDGLRGKIERAGKRIVGFVVEREVREIDKPDKKDSPRKSPAQKKVPQRKVQQRKEREAAERKNSCPELHRAIKVSSSSDNFGTAHPIPCFAAPARR